MFDLPPPFNMIVLIVLIGVGGGIITQYLKSKEDRRTPEQDADIDAMKQEIAKLRERVNTLERIHTDPDTRLEREFRNL